MLSKLLLLGVPFALWPGCAGQSVTFRSDEPATVSAVDWEDLATERQAFGQTPVTLKASAIDGKVIKISEANKVPQYWVVTCDKDRETMEAKVKLADLPTKPGTSDAGTHDAPRSDASLNALHRQLLRSYEALVSGDDRLAGDLADDLHKKEPGLSSPLIIAGLSHLNRGQRDEARTDLLKAAELDPEDARVKRLIQLTEAQAP